MDRGHIMEGIDGSLCRLGTDYVDLYMRVFCIPVLSTVEWKSPRAWPTQKPV